MNTGKKATLKGEVSEEVRDLFKIACVKKKVTMGEVLEKIVMKWLESIESIGISEEEFLRMLADNKKPDTIQLVTLSETKDLPIELLEKITDCVFDGVKNGV